MYWWRGAQFLYSRIFLLNGSESSTNKGSVSAKYYPREIYRVLLTPQNCHLQNWFCRVSELIDKKNLASIDYCASVIAYGFTLKNHVSLRIIMCYVTNPLTKNWFNNMDKEELLNHASLDTIVRRSFSLFQLLCDGRGGRTNW